MNISNLTAHIKSQIAICDNTSIKARLNMFLNVHEKHLSITVATERAGLSRKTYYKWWNRYKSSNYSLDSLLDESKTPDTLPNITPKHIQERLFLLHEQYPHYGSAKIAHQYFIEYNLIISATAVYKVFLRNNIIKTKSKKPKNKHTKKYQKSIPGERMQMDVKYVPSILTVKKCYQFSIIDDCTRIKYTEIFEELTPANTVAFVKNAYRYFKSIGIIIQLVQTDNGTEFTYRFLKFKKATGEPTQHPMDKLCDQLHIRHRLIPPATPQLNGKVERSHKTDQIEFYDYLIKDLNGNKISIENLCLKRKLFDNYYNYERIHAGINYLSPMQKLEKIQKLDTKERALDNALKFIAA